jgi:hypothetical protein
MSKEQQELLDDAYENYCISYKDGHEFYEDEEIKRSFTREEFINKCKIEPEFSEKWGLKVEERELSLEERSFIAGSNHNEVAQNINMFVGVNEDHTLHKNLDGNNIPTKLITITYNDKTIKSRI